MVSDLDPRVELVLRTAIRKQPEQRYPSMKIFSEDLRKLDTPDAALWAQPNAEADVYELADPIAKNIGRMMRRYLE